ncbi:MAG TPA: long-chain fatty acid--CoA ligase [Burkholderiales bacterium]|jgi:long-chain acyl-CoA synthetase|nr:long-chain fatty acid--CoA ligase [Burkholderiales bacterium]
MNQAQLLLRSARWLPERPAIAVGKRTVQSYRELAFRAQKLGSAITGKFSLNPGDRVALAMKNCPEYWEVLFAIWHAGLAAVPMNAKLHPKEFEYILGNSGAKVCFVTSDLESSLSFFPNVISTGTKEFKTLEGTPEGPHPSKPEDLAWLFYTSGTTGVPKGAMLTHRNLLFSTQAYYADIEKVEPADAILHAAPLTHGSGLYGLAHFGAGSVNVIPESGSFDAEEIFGLLDHWPGTSFFAAPTMVVRLLASGAARAPRRLKTIMYGGAPMYVADALRAIELFGGRHLYQLYGQGESPMTITGLSSFFHEERIHLETCGMARTGVEVKIFNDEDEELPAGEVGEIVTRSDCVMAGYWQNAEATAKTLRGGWLHTGDVGSLDAEGFLTLRDRSKDMIISGGSNIYPREIEEVLLRHPAVAECSVIGRPHAEWGEEVIAFVVLKNTSLLKPEELDSLCLENIARFKRPREYRFVDALPKNNYGKVLKTELRKRL